MAEMGSNGQIASPANNERLLGAGVASGELAQLDTAMRDSGFTQDDIVRVNARLNDAVSHGVPSGPLLDKINEGIAKGVAAEQIVRAMAMVAERYARAGQYVGALDVKQTAHDTVLPLLVATQTAGMAADDLDRIISRLGEVTGRDNSHTDEDRLIRATLIFTREMRRLGVPSALVADLASSLLAKGADSAYFTDMTGSFRKIRDRRMVEEQARLCLGRLEAGADIGEVQNSVQSRMGNGPEPEQTMKSESESEQGAGQGESQGQENGSSQQDGDQNSGGGGGEASDNGGSKAGDGMANSGGDSERGGQGQQGK
jgi:cobalamin biosynthesis protein CobT